jgi:hypothetical protein
MTGNYSECPVFAHAAGTTVARCALPMKAYRHALFAAAAVTIALLPGCRSESETDVGPCEEVDCSQVESQLDKPSCCPHPHSILALDFSACEASVPRAKILEVATTGVWLQRSLEALEDGVDLGFQLSGNAGSVFVQLAEAPKADALTLPFSHDAATGEYTASLVSTGKGTITARFLFSEDYQAGKAGNPILPYLFRTESYVGGAGVTVDSGVATVSYASEGPLVEMLGYGPHPPNPFSLGLFDDTELPKQTVDLHIVDDEIRPDGFAGSFEARVQRIIGPGPFQSSDVQVPIDLVSATFEGRAGAKIVITSFDLQAVDGGYHGQHLRGTVRFRIEGGAVPFDGVILYDDSGPPELQLICSPS